MDYRLQQIAIIATIILVVSFVTSLVVRPAKKRSQRHNAWDGNEVESYMNFPNVQLPYKEDIKLLVGGLGALNATLQELNIAVKDIAVNMRK